MHIVRTTTDEQSDNRSEEDYERDERKKKHILAERWNEVNDLCRKYDEKKD
jgi:hypothetical protein